LDGLRHGRAAAPRGLAHGDLVPRRLVPAGGVQPQAADEEALAGDGAVPGPVHPRGRAPAGAAGPPALPRPRRDHGAGAAGPRLTRPAPRSAASRRILTTASWARG